MIDNKYIYEIDSDNVKEIMHSNSINDERKIYSLYTKNNIESNVTIIVQAYNRIEKTKKCISSILKYTSDVDYDLLLIDNGSTDNTFDYFKSVNCIKKRIIHLSKNISVTYPTLFYDLSWLSRYVVVVQNDLIVTPHWLSNLIKVAESDDRIGMVNPVSSNVSNFQQVDLEFDNLEEMERAAESYNKSEPKLWQERIRLITLGTLYKKECLYAIGWPFNDVGFYHDFSDDDISFRVRRVGYKAVLAVDTWIHHNHDVFNLDYDNLEEHQRSLEIGRKNFKDKYFGIDAWDDVNNFIPEYTNVLQLTSSERKSILGIDVRCGMPILEMKNRLRNFGIFDADCFAFTQQGKYFIDLQTVCGPDRVHTGDINRIGECFAENSLDYIVIGDDINSYPEPIYLIRDAYKLLKNGGQLFISLKNTYDFFTFLNIIGNGRNNDQPHVVNYSVEQFLNVIAQEGMNAKYITARQYNLSSDVYAYSKDCMEKLAGDGAQESAFRLMADRYFFAITK